MIKLFFALSCIKSNLKIQSSNDFLVYFVHNKKIEANSIL